MINQPRPIEDRVRLAQVEWAKFGHPGRPKIEDDTQVTGPVEPNWTMWESWTSWTSWSAGMRSV